MPKHETKEAAVGMPLTKVIFKRSSAAARPSTKNNNIENKFFADVDDMPPATQSNSTDLSLRGTLDVSAAALPLVTKVASAGSGKKLGPKAQAVAREEYRRIWVKYGQKKVTGKTSAFEGWSTQCRYYRCYHKGCPAKRHILKPLDNLSGDESVEAPAPIVHEVVTNHNHELTADDSDTFAVVEVTPDDDPTPVTKRPPEPPRTKQVAFTIPRLEGGTLHLQNGSVQLTPQQQQQLIVAQMMRAAQMQNNQALLNQVLQGMTGLPPRVLEAAAVASNSQPSSAQGSAQMIAQAAASSSALRRQLESIEQARKLNQYHTLLQQQEQQRWDQQLRQMTMTTPSASNPMTGADMTQVPTEFASLVAPLAREVPSEEAFNPWDPANAGIDASAEVQKLLDTLQPPQLGSSQLGFGPPFV